MPTLPNRLEDGEPISRFVFDSRHFSTVDRKAKPKAFEPKNNCVSVLRAIGLTDAEVWDWAVTYVEPERGKACRARADLTVVSVRRLILDLVRDEPPPRHANIVGWPDDKSAQKLLSIELAAEATLVVR